MKSRPVLQKKSLFVQAFEPVNCNTLSYSAVTFYASSSVADLEILIKDTTEIYLQQEWRKVRL